MSDWFVYAVAEAHQHPEMSDYRDAMYPAALVLVLVIAAAKLGFF